jgi:hypothetical protein
MPPTVVTQTPPHVGEVHPLRSRGFLARRRQALLVGRVRRTSVNLRVHTFACGGHRRANASSAVSLSHALSHMPGCMCTAPGRAPAPWARARPACGLLGRAVPMSQCRAVAELGPSKLCQRLAEYQYVIHEDQDKLPHVLLKYDIHQILESCWCISKPKRHYSELEIRMVGFKGSFGLITRH